MCADQSTFDSINKMQSPNTSITLQLPESHPKTCWLDLESTSFVFLPFLPFTSPSTSSPCDGPFPTRSGHVSRA